MEVISAINPESVTKAQKIIKNGGVIVFPTDTAYGLGVDATNDTAVEKLYDLKGREKGKPMHVVVSNIDMARKYVEINSRAERLSQAFLPGPLSLVLVSKDEVSKLLQGNMHTLGIRIPKDNFACELVHHLDVPITATSANKSGDPAAYSIKEVEKSFGKDYKKIDLIVDSGELEQIVPSTLVDISSVDTQILREGPVSREEILRVLF